MIIERAIHIAGKGHQGRTSRIRNRSRFTAQREKKHRKYKHLYTHGGYGIRLKTKKEG